MGGGSTGYELKVKGDVASVNLEVETAVTVECDEEGSTGLGWGVRALRTRLRHGNEGWWRKGYGIASDMGEDDRDFC